MVKRICVIGILGFCSVYLLYKNVWFSMAGMLVFVFYGVMDKKSLEEERRKKIQAKFLDFLMCLEPLLKNSGTFCIAFSEAVSDYKRFHGEDELSFYLDAAVNDFMINISTSDVLIGMAKKMKLEDAYAFAKSMAICELTGGNAVDVTERTTELLVGKIRILCDIGTSLSGKVLEQKIITIMPFMLLGLFAVTAKSYLEPLYNTYEGKIVMTIAGALFLIQWFIGKKITSIKV
ncbi:MAG: hypothetical protein J7L77_09925 [Clostridiales bacterium]|nr:hypothetical protein [Clostridiales bacterium]